MEEEDNAVELLVDEEWYCIIGGTPEERARKRARIHAGDGAEWAFYKAPEILAFFTNGNKGAES